MNRDRAQARDKTGSPRHAGQRGLKAVRPGARPIAGLIPNITRKAFEKYGFSTASLLTDWSAIIGPDLAKYTAPERLKWPRNVKIYADIDGDDQRGRPGATLILRVDGARAIEIQYKSAQIMDRINAYFGYRAISEMRILQAPVANPSAAPAKTYRKLEPLPETPAEIAVIKDEALREVLGLMAAGLHRRRISR